METHVQHAVRLIEDEVRNCTKTDVPCLDKIEQAARSGNEDMHAPRELLLLLGFVASTIDTHHMHTWSSTSS